MGELFEGLLGGTGVGIVAGVVIGAVASRDLRPLAKGIVQAGLAAGDRLSTWTAQMGEQTSDLVAEARAEHAQAKSVATTPPVGETP